MSDQLVEQLIARAQRDVDRKIKPVPAGPAAPATLRAFDKISRSYPEDAVGVGIADIPMLDPYAFNRSMAHVQIDKKDGVGDPYLINVNPAYSALMPEGSLRRIMAHELEHIRQNKSDMSVKSRLDQHSMDYDSRPDEIAARKASDNFDRDFGEIEAWKMSYPLMLDPLMAELSRLWRGDRGGR